jgi:hypothetical protein
MNLTMELISAFLVSIIGGLMTGAVLVVSMRTDIVWLKKLVDKIDSSAEAAHRRIDLVEIKLHRKMNNEPD